MLLIRPIEERWALRTPGKESVDWLEIYKEGRGFGCRWVASIIFTGEEPPPEPKVTFTSLEAVRASVKKLRIEGTWYGPVPAAVKYQDLTAEELSSYDASERVNIAFRLCYKDKAFNAEAAIAALQSFVHDAVVAAQSPKHETPREVQVIVTFNQPKPETTRVVEAREGDAWPLDERGFR